VGGRARRTRPDADKPLSDLWSATHGPAPVDGAPIVVFVHGSMDRSSGFARVTRHLPDVPVLRYDRRGYGRSLAALGEGPGFGVDEHVDDLLALLDGRPAVVVGHSFGGDVALAAAQRAPSTVRAVVAYEAPMAWEPWWPSRSAGAAAVQGPDGDPGDAAERFLRRMLGDARWEGLPPKVRATRRAEGRALVGELSSLRTAAPYAFDRLPMPVVAGRGGHSRDHHRQAMAELASRVPDGELFEIPGAAHDAHVSHSEQFAGLVQRAMARTLA
jgi:pimeloyl-ACP methyl ester carboxylesterase